VEDWKGSPNYRPFASHRTTGLQEGSLEGDSPEEEYLEEVEDTLEEAPLELDPLAEDGDQHQFNCHNPKQEN